MTRIAGFLILLIVVIASKSNELMASLINAGLSTNVILALTIGTGVIGGVVTSTFLVIIFAPLFYVLVERTFGRQKGAVTKDYGRRSTDRPSGPERRKNR